MKQPAKTIFFTLALLTSICLIFIGLRFLITPAAAETAFGIRVPVDGHFAFHYIKGIRDLFSGVVIGTLLLSREYRALGILSLLAAMVPATDFLLVLNQAGHATASLYPHLSAVIIALAMGIYYLRTPIKK